MYSVEMMSAWGKKLSIALLSALIALVLCEVAFRFLVRAQFQEKLASFSHELWLPRSDRAYLYELKPGASVENEIDGHPELTWTCTIDDEGRRVTDGSPTEIGTRVVALGDSYTFGWGVNDSDAYPAQLARILNEVDPAHPVTVINAGFPGFNTWQESAYLRENWDSLSPDVVVLGFVMNDAEPTRIVPRNPDVRYGMAPIWLWEDLILRLGLVDKPFKSRLQRQRDYREQFQAGTPEYRLCRRALGQLSAFCKGRGVPLRIFVFPDTTAFRSKPYRYDAIHDQVVAWGLELDVPTVDLLPDFEGARLEDISVPQDGHPNGAALGRFANRIADELRTLISNDR